MQQFMVIHMLFMKKNKIEKSSQINGRVFLREDIKRLGNIFMHCFSVMDKMGGVGNNKNGECVHGIKMMPCLLIML